MKDISLDVLNRVVQRAHLLASQMVYLANHRSEKEKGDPKVGGHCSAAASAIHIMGAIHLVLRSGFDHVANKPHASPADHAYNYLMDLLLDGNNKPLSLDKANQAMANLRKFPQEGEFAFQSYHSSYDPDHHNFFPSGTVGIPPVAAGYLAHAYRFAKDQGHEVPDAHFWAVMGDSEFREGSLLEAAPDFGERELGNLTWVIDYNRQSLDGHRLVNPRAVGASDNMRIEKTMLANGWDVIQVRHGQKRLALFKKPGGDAFKNWFENELSDYELQAILLVKDKKLLREHMLAHHPETKEFLANVSDDEFYLAMHDFGGHDLLALITALKQSQQNPRKPCLVIAHTIKGWGLDMAAASGNHNTVVSIEELNSLRKQQGLSEGTEFVRFDEKSKEGQFCKQRGQELYQEILAQYELKNKNLKSFQDKLKARPIPDAIDINLKLASYPHTQWMLGQLTSKLTRIANTPVVESKLQGKQKALSEAEKNWKAPAELIVSMAPDVGTSTNLNPSMDGKIFGSGFAEDFEEELHVKDPKTPDLIPGDEPSDRFIRFEIEEGSTMSCAGSYGRLRDVLGIPILPLMTIYDFFIKRALDQYFYNLYWKSSFILVGTPSGVSLSPEGAQHCWKSDFQIPNQITWEPFFCQELDWILSDAIDRHVRDDNANRSGVLIRGTTRGADQKDFLKYLKRQRRFKTQLSDNQLIAPQGLEIAGAISESEVASLAEDEILTTVRNDVLEGAYKLIDYEGYAGYEPGDNVVNIFAMGTLGTEAIKASEELLNFGIYANVIMVTSPDLLVGSLGRANSYRHLRHRLGVSANLFLQPQLNGNWDAAEVVTLAGRRVPCVSVHDGEPGMLDNIGSIVGVRHEALAVHKHSRSGRPSDVYSYHGIDSRAVVEACGKVLAETALEHVQVSRRALQQTQSLSAPQGDWRQLWPQIQKQ